jgi:hypothetical protein
MIQAVSTADSNQKNKKFASQSVKTAKWIFAIFPLQPAVSQSVPAEMGGRFYGFCVKFTHEYGGAS